jgi:carboxymethylenebutenolidase
MGKEIGEGQYGELGVTGFCWGGRIVWLYAAHNKALKAGVAWYGRLTGNKTDLQPQYPLDLVKSLKAPVLGLYGAIDKGIPVATVEQMQEALKEAKQLSEIVVYPDTDHGFYADYRPTYKKSSADDGWKRLQEWFKKHGVT